MNYKLQNHQLVSFASEVVRFISILYEDIESKNGLGKVLINTSVVELKDDKGYNALKNNLILRVENFLNCFYKVETLSKCFSIGTRLAESPLASTLIMLEFHPIIKITILIF